MNSNNNDLLALRCPFQLASWMHHLDWWYYPSDANLSNNHTRVTQGDANDRRPPQEVSHVLFYEQLQSPANPLVTVTCAHDSPLAEYRVVDWRIV